MYTYIALFSGNLYMPSWRYIKSPSLEETRSPILKRIYFHIFPFLPLQHYDTLSNVDISDKILFSFLRKYFQAYVKDSREREFVDCEKKEREVQNNCFFHHSVFSNCSSPPFFPIYFFIPSPIPTLCFYIIRTTRNLV